MVRVDEPSKEGYDFFEASFGKKIIIEAGSGRFIGSNYTARGLKMINRDITTDWTDMGTIIQLIGESSIAMAP